MCAGSQSGTRSATQAILAQSLEPWTAEGTACPVPKAESSAAKGEARASWTTAAIHPCSLTNSGGTCAFLPAHLWQVVDRVYIQDSTQFEPSTTCPGAAANQSHSAELLLSSPLSRCPTTATLSSTELQVGASNRSQRPALATRCHIYRHIRRTTTPPYFFRTRFDPHIQLVKVPRILANNSVS